jgi:hypothetical protein
MNPTAPATLPDVNGLSVPQAALAYVRSGIPVVPFDVARGNHKECGNLVGGDGLPPWFEQVTTDHQQLRAWRAKFGRFTGLATSPGAFGCVVIDVDAPEHLPTHWRGYLTDQSVPYVSTRATQKRRGHYWFACGEALPNRSYVWGDVRSVRGGIVLPPYEGRTTVRAGVPPTLPSELLEAFKAGAGGVRDLVDLAAFIARHTEQRLPGKLKGIRAIYAREAKHSRHNAAREALTLGFREARAGYVSAQNVYDAIREQWSKGQREFVRLAQWCASVADETELAEITAKSTRDRGMDSRKYGNKLR